MTARYQIEAMEELLQEREQEQTPHPQQDIPGYPGWSESPDEIEMRIGNEMLERRQRERREREQQNR